MDSPRADRPGCRPARLPAPRTATLLILLTMLTVATFWPVTGNDFVAYDDNEYVTDNGIVRHGLSPQGLRWAFTTTKTGNWHPVTWLSHMLDVEVFGLRPGWHHAMSLAIHAANVLLLWRLLVALTGAPLRGALVAALFAVHPLHVESVAWAAERKDLLCTLFALLAALVYLRCLRRRGGGHARIAVSALYALSLLSKPMTVTFPFLLLLLDWWPLDRWSPGAAAPSRVPGRPSRALPPAALWLEKAPLFALSGAFTAIAVLAQHGIGAMTPVSVLPLSVRAANAALSPLRYLGATLRPISLQVHYPHAAALPPATLLGGAILTLAALTAAAWLQRRRRPWCAVGWLWYLGTLVPVIGLVQVGTQALADRYTYLPLVGVFLVVAWSLPRLPPSSAALRAVAPGAAAVALAALATLSNARVREWRTSLTLFSVEARRSSNPTVAHSALANWYVGQGQFEQALDHGLAALRDQPDAADLNNNLGAILMSMDRRDEALPYLRAAVAGNPDLAQGLYNLGLVLASRGELEEAIALFLRVTQIAPETPGARLYLGRALAQAGRTREAIREFESLLAEAPGDPRAHVDLGLALAGQGDDEQAVAHFLAALRSEPGNTETWRRLGEAYRRLGRDALADQALRRTEARDDQR